MAEGLPRYHLQQVLHPREIQLVEKVVQQQDGRIAGPFLHDFILRELERHQEGLLLPLAAAVADCMTVELEAEVVALQTRNGIAQGEVPLAAGG